MFAKNSISNLKICSKWLTRFQMISSGMKVNREKQVLVYATASRILCVLLAVLSHSGANMEVQRNTIIFSADPHPMWLYTLISPFIQWDGIHFLNIALHGYDSVLEHAFFPGLPIMMRTFASILPSLSNTASMDLALGGILFVQLSAVLGALGLFRLSSLVLGGPEPAFRATLFYIFAPCNIFMSAVYTESPFSMLTFWGLYWLYVKRSLVLASLLLATAGLFRSNGILAVAFVVHSCITKGRSYIKAALSAACIYLPYFLYSNWARGLYCDDLPEPHKWCDQYSSIYSYIQKQFWGVSLFSYWKWEHWGYFMLMIPSLVVACHAPVHFISDHWRITTKAVNSNRIFRDEKLAYLAQMGVLTAFTVFVANCQILTRILSSCPLYFWTLERMTQDRSSLIGQAVVFAHLVYYVLGPVMFANGLNWT